MTRVMLAGSLLAALATPALATDTFWVVGSHTTGKCEIVTSNPVVDGGNIWFGDGPYKSRSDAKLARSTITACPKVEPGKDEANEEK
ncbi:MAG TPA: hypothetical protein VKY22_17505 [Bradyrhizobium sp.]|jgi:hypothetical protein|nr:hypothetical protein [Bradyrhizobium sp.]